MRLLTIWWQDDPVLVEIGKKYNKTGAQVALAWGIAQGHTVLPKSKTPSRIKANLEGDFKLDAEDMAKIEKIDKKARFNDASEGFGYKFFTDLDGKEWLYVVREEDVPIPGGEMLWKSVGLRNEIDRVAAGQRLK